MHELAIGIHEGIPESVYHSMPYISASFLKRFRQNPAATSIEISQTPAMVLGSASHAYTLEGEEAFWDRFTVAPKVDKRTKEGKAQWLAFEQVNAGKTLIDQDQFDAVVAMHQSVTTHPFAKNLLKRGNPELTIIWIDPETGLKCKARIDHNTNKNVLVDYKTTSSAEGFTKQLVNLNYDIQAAHYTAAATAAGLQPDAFVFVACETSEPHPVRCGMLNADWLVWAKDERNRLMGLVKECLEQNTLPNYTIPGHIYSINQITSADLLEEWEMPKWRV